MHGARTGILQSFGGLKKVYADLAHLSIEMAQVGRLG